MSAVWPKRQTVENLTCMQITGPNSTSSYQYGASVNSSKQSSNVTQVTISSSPSTTDRSSRPDDKSHDAFPSSGLDERQSPDSVPVAGSRQRFAGGVEIATGVRIELHGTHGGRVLPHLQAIKGNPGVGPYDWGKTIGRWPPH